MSQIIFADLHLKENFACAWRNLSIWLPTYLSLLSMCTNLFLTTTLFIKFVFYLYLSIYGTVFKLMEWTCQQCRSFEETKMYPILKGKNTIISSTTMYQSKKRLEKITKGALFLLSTKYKSNESEEHHVI